MTVILFGVGSTIEQKIKKQRRNSIWSPNDCDTFRSELTGNETVFVTGYKLTG